MKKLNVLVPSVLALFVASAAHAGATFDTPQGKLNIGGDVEYNLDAEHVNGDSVYTDNQSANGRILLDINGERVLSNGNFAAFKINPHWNVHQVDDNGEDAWFSFGVKNDWAFKMGHFETYDLSPNGQDTYVANSGMMMYRMKETRNRNNNGSDVMLSKEAGQWHMELDTDFTATPNDNSIYGTTSNPLSYGSDAHANKEPVLVRPVVAWTGDTVTVAAGAELNLITDAYTSEADGKGENLSDWSGYGLTTTVKATDDLSFTLSGTYRNADEFDQYTVGPQMQYQNFFLAYYYGVTDIDGDANKTKEHLTYASYKIPGVMGMDNFDMYLGASYGKIDTGVGDDTNNYGARVRFKYFF